MNECNTMYRYVTFERNIINAYKHSNINGLIAF